jgi:hypothetical protein
LTPSPKRPTTVSKLDGRTYRRQQVCTLCRRHKPWWHIVWRSTTGNTETEAYLCADCTAKLETWKVVICQKTEVAH